MSLNDNSQIADAVRMLFDTCQDLNVKMMAAKATLKELEEQLDEIQGILNVLKRK